MSQSTNSPITTEASPTLLADLETDTNLNNEGFDPEDQNSEGLNWVNTNSNEFATFDPSSIARKTRRRTNKQEQAILENSFKADQRPDVATREKLAKQLGMSVRAIQIWFQNKRQTLKKKKADPLIVPVQSDLEDEDGDDKGPGFTVLKISDCRVIKRPQLSWQSKSKRSPQLNADEESVTRLYKSNSGYLNQTKNLREHKRRKSFSPNITYSISKNQMFGNSELIPHEVEDGLDSLDRRRHSDHSDYSNLLPHTPETPSTNFMDKTATCVTSGSFLFSPPFSAIRPTTNVLATAELFNTVGPHSAAGNCYGWSPNHSQTNTPLSLLPQSPRSMQLPPITPVQGPGISPLAYQHSPHMNPYNMDPLILPPPLVPDESTNRHKIPSGHARNHSLPSIRTLPENHDLSLSPLVLKEASSPMVYFPGSASKLMASQDGASPMFLPDPISPSSLKLSSIDQAQKEKIRPRV